MTAKKFWVYFLIMLLTIYPASASGISLNRWVLNVTMHDDGLVEEVIQSEIENGGSSPLDGLSFVVPASGVTMVYDFDHTYSFTGLVVEQQTVPGGVKVNINFNKSIDAGNKWDGRIGFIAEKWAVKDGSNYSIEIPFEAPEALVSGKSTPIEVPEDADIRVQVFLPKSVEVTNVTPKPFRILFQFDHMVPTWSSDKLHIGDTIRTKGSYSDILDKIVKTDEKTRDLSVRIKEAKAQGKDVSEAEMHLANAENYNTNQALGAFWKNNYSEVLSFVGYANDELQKAENNLVSVSSMDAGKTSGTTKATETTGSKAAPLPGAPVLIIILIAAFLFSRKK